MPVARHFVGFCLIILSFVFAGPAEAALDQVYTVQGVKVEATAQTATKARERAMSEAQALAFRKLLERLTLAADRHRLPELELSEIVELVQDVQVENEKNSATRYIASMAVTFKSDPIRRLLKIHNLPFTEVVSKPVLVVPVYQARRNGPVQLWEDTNPWRHIWLNRKETDGLVPMTIPLGDLEDVTSLTASQAQDAETGALTALAQRYGASDVLVSHAVLIQPSPPVIEVYVTRTGSALQEQTTLKTFAGSKGETLTQVLSQALEGMVVLGEENWKQDNLMQFGGSSGQMTVLVPLKGLGDWLMVRKNLSEVPVLSSHTIQAIKKDLAQLTLQYVGDEQQLALALSQKDLILKKNGSAWMLSLQRSMTTTAPKEAAPAAPAE